MFDNFNKVNFSAMSDVALARWIRDNSYYQNLNVRMNLVHSLHVARMVKEAYRLGEIRGNIFKKLWNT